MNPSQSEQVAGRILATAIRALTGAGEAMVASAIERRADDGSQLCEFLQSVGSTRSPAYIDGERRTHPLRDDVIAQAGKDIWGIWKN